jgi:hypothetical protein
MTEAFALTIGYLSILQHGRELHADLDDIHEQKQRANSRTKERAKAAKPSKLNDKVCNPLTLRCVPACACWLQGCQKHRTVDTE